MAFDKSGPVANGALRKLAWLTPALLFVMLAGSAWFYQVRMLYIDAPHILLLIINTGRVWCEEHRYGAVVAQLLPLIGSKMHLPFRALLLLYSVNFYLFYLAVSLLLAGAFKNYRLAMLMGLCFTLFESDAWYWANNEVAAGLSWLLLAFAMNLKFAEKKRPLPAVALLFIASFFIAIWTHPLVMLAAIYLWFFLMTGSSLWPYSKVQSALLTVFLLALSLIKFAYGVRHGYDSSKFGALTHFQLQKITSIFSSPQLHFFMHSCLHNYKTFSLLAVVSLAALLLTKRYIALLWTVLCICAYMTLVCITFWDTNSRSYMECEYMPLIIICCTPFVYYVAPHISGKAAMLLFILIYAVRLATIYNASPPYTHRLALLENMVTKMKEKRLMKVIIPEPAPIDDALFTNWAAPAESMCISELMGDSPQRSFIFLDRNQVSHNDTTVTNMVLGSSGILTAGNFSNYYFRIDTTSAYKVIGYDDLMR